MATRRFSWNTFAKWIGIHLVVLLILACAGFIWLVSLPEDSQPKRHYDAKAIQKVAPKQVNSAWRFETISASKRIGLLSPSLALDSEGSPRVAYGGDQLYYAWFDGHAWQHEVADASPGAGDQTRLLFDAAGQPHIIYSVGDARTMYLAHAYKNSSGWQRETVRADFCQKTIYQVSLDPQGRLGVVFGGLPRCAPANNSGDNSSHLWLVRQAADGWHIAEISSEGLFASLAYDSSGQAYVTYYVQSRGGIYLATGSGQGWTSQQIMGGLPDYSTTFAFFDPQAALHVIYSASSKNGHLIKHGWKDASGWHFEDAFQWSSQATFLKVLAGAQGQPNLIFSEPDKGLYRVQRGASGWNQAPEYFGYPTFYMWGLDVKIDPGGKYHLVYTTTEGTLFYATGQGKDWQTVALDRGITLDRPRSALAFDRNGGLAVSYYASDKWVHYLWKDGDTWRTETVGKVPDDYNNYPIDLLFDPQNRPRIFYIGAGGGNTSSHSPAHAYRDQGEWKAEALDISVYGFSEWGKPVISPEGWPVFYRQITSGQPDSTLIYCAPQGCRKQYLAFFSPSIDDYDYPVIAYPPQKTTGSLAADGVSIPGFAYIIKESHELAWVDPRYEQEKILHILDKGDYVRRLSLAYNPQGRPLIFAGVMRPSVPGGKTTESLFSVTWDEYGWKAYQFEDMLYPLYDPVLDSTGQAHFVQGYFSYTSSGGSQGFYYVTGSGPDWKITPIQGKGLNQDNVEIRIVGAAVRQDTGEFCALFYNKTTNDLIVGCLDTTE